MLSAVVGDCKGGPQTYIVSCKPRIRSMECPGMLCAVAGGKSEGGAQRPIPGPGSELWSAAACYVMLIWITKGGHKRLS